jgi:hypothetical protein
MLLLIQIRETYEDQSVQEKSDTTPFKKRL